ncbi:hypothetical protein CCP3SC1_60002 [Gammaproteobacteria bacterium]
MVIQNTWLSATLQPSSKSSYPLFLFNFLFIQDSGLEQSIALSESLLVGSDKFSQQDNAYQRKTLDLIGNPLPSSAGQRNLMIYIDCGG